MFGPFGPWGLDGFSWNEFLFGVILTTIFFVVYTRLLQPILSRPLGEVKGWFGGVRGTISIRARDRYRSALVARSETMHLARPIFALDEVLIVPRVLAPPITSDHSSEESLPADTLAVLPNLPDSTFLSGIYAAPTIALPLALKNGANLLLTGEPGSGKTTALAYLAIRMLQKDPELEFLAEFAPILIHAADLSMDKEKDEDVLAPIITAAQQMIPARSGAFLPNYIRKHFGNGTALLLLDGLDEFSPREIRMVADWLKMLQAEYPNNRLVAAGPTFGYVGLADVGLVPVTMSPWTEYDRRQFLTKWSQSWIEFVLPTLPKRRIDDIDPQLLNGWLASAMRGLSPADVTLMTWAAYAGDMRGPRTVDCMDSYLERLLSKDELQHAEAAALAWLSSHEGAAAERNLRRGTPVSDLAEAGVVIRRINSKVSFSQPAIGAYLAARAMSKSGLSEAVSEAVWAPAEASMRYFAMLGDAQEAANRYLDSEGDPLETDLLTSAQWLFESPTKAPWRSRVLRAVGRVVQDTRRPYGLRLRGLHAMVQSGEPTVNVLFQRMLSSDDPTSRVLAALGLGGTQHEDSVGRLATALNVDKELMVRQAACLGLAAIGTNEALEALGHALLGGEESVRLAAAEALAINPDEGYNMIRDGAEHDELLTRRAAVFGLARIPEEWAAKILEEIQIEDSQWVVRGAAVEAIERRKDPPWKVLPRQSDVSELPWLVSFASKRGLGVSPGRPAMDLVRKALNDGTPEEKLAALEVIANEGAVDLALDLFQALGSRHEYLRDAAYEALWRLAAMGEELPVPA
jgi:HEAT repeat protein/energy-coupling factor transporter ATP-binding protein EcfA2